MTTDGHRWSAQNAQGLEVLAQGDIRTYVKCFPSTTHRRQENSSLMCAKVFSIIYSLYSNVFSPCVHLSMPTLLSLSSPSSLSFIVRASTTKGHAFTGSQRPSLGRRRFGRICGGGARHQRRAALRLASHCGGPQRRAPALRPRARSSLRRTQMIQKK